MKNKTLKNAKSSERIQPTAKKERFRELTKRVALVSITFGLFIMIIPAQWRLLYLTTSAFLLIITTCIAAAQIMRPEKYDISPKWASIIKSYENLNRRLQLYLNVFLCIPFLAYFYALGGQDIFIQIAILFFIYCLGVAAYDIYRIYAALYSTTIGKGLIAIAFAIGSNLAFSFSGIIIGEMTHVPPTTFPHTLAFLAIFAIPFLFMAAGAIFFPISIAMAPFFIYGLSFAAKAPRLMKWFFGVEVKDQESRHAITTVIFQILFYIIILALTPAILLALLNQYSEQMEFAIARSIYHLDMYPGTECKVPDNYRQASLGDDNYILASKSPVKVDFEPPKKCAL